MTTSISNPPLIDTSGFAVFAALEVISAIAKEPGVTMKRASLQMVDYKCAVKVELLVDRPEDKQ